MHLFGILHSNILRKIVKNLFLKIQVVGEAVTLVKATSDSVYLSLSKSLSLGIALGNLRGSNFYFFENYSKKLTFVHMYDVWYYL